MRSTSDYIKENNSNVVKIGESNIHKRIVEIVSGSCDFPPMTELHDNDTLTPSCSVFQDIIISD
jgi:hypothetical protein